MIPSETKFDQAPGTEKYPAIRTEEEKKIDRTAEDAAEKSSKTEKRYDRDHNIFTK